VRNEILKGGEKMERTDYSLLALTQTMNQSRQLTNAVGNSEKDGQFQGLMNKKSKETTQNNADSKTETTDTPTAKVQTKAAKQGDDPEEDPVTKELAYAQLLMPDVVPMEPQTPQIQETVEPIAVQELTATALETAEQTPEIADVVTPEAQPELSVPEGQATETEAVSEPAIEPVPVQTEAPEAQSGQSQGNDLPTEAQDEDTHVEVTEAPEAQAQPVFRDVEPVMIKVGEAPAVEETEQAADLNQQVAEPLMNALSQGETKVEIQLSPRSLGNVTVELTQQQDGALNVVLTAENSHTRDLLKQHVGGLQELLGSQNQRTVQVEVTRPQETQHDTPNYDGRNGHGNSNGQQEQRQRHTQHNSQDFLQQLRLGLIPLDVQTS
jgi:flagellar hook-length control protein FliK